MELDEAFKNIDYIEGGTEYPARWAASAEQFRAQSDCELDIPYGPSLRQKLDIFLPEGTPKGTVVFIHGGYWRMFDKSTWSHLAAGAVARGWRVMLPGYDLCPDVRISEIQGQIRSAIDLIADRFDGPLRLTGHSAGGQLASRMVSSDIAGRWLPRVEKVMPISPVADLRPLLKTSMNADFQLDDASAAADSPVLQPKPDLEVSVWVGADERPIFLSMAEDQARAWGCDCHKIENLHHFNIIEGLEEPDSPMLADLLG